jgi:hypothetical protein
VGKKWILHAAPHPHAHGGNIVQHRSCGENQLSHMETGDKSNADNKMQRGSQADMWQFRNIHNPKRKNNTQTYKKIKN